MKKNTLSALFIGFVLAGCAGASEPTTNGAVDDPVLTSVDTIFDGAPTNEELPSEAKADETFPLRFTDNVELQSAVKSQGSRGVCSIFSTAAYMEHLYIAEGTIKDLDVSEQYLQWSAKFEVNSFPKTSGSNANFNLQAISRFGVPEEDAWPYETSEWGTSEDEACDGEDTQPTRCYTNGAPPEEALEADKFFLPRNRFISTFPRSIKAHMFNRKQAVVVGLTFFYQSWNHRRSKLPRNLDYWNEGYVLYPNADDKEISLEKRAGHSIVLVGWDDELEVPIRDKEGKVVLDDDGEQVTEKGFFLFKNSWGTGSFGAENKFGDGYGWISMRYVREFGSGRIADIPVLEKPDEICGDGLDNDGNGDSDCDDIVCADKDVCLSSSEILTLASSDEIPDNDPTGLDVPFTIETPGELKALTITVDIEHTYSGDLSLVLTSPSGKTFQLHEATGRAAQDLKQTFVVEDVAGEEGEGDWAITIFDEAAIDTGHLRGGEVEVIR